MVTVRELLSKITGRRAELTEVEQQLPEAAPLTRAQLAQVTPISRVQRAEAVSTYEEQRQRALQQVEAERAALAKQEAEVQRQAHEQELIQQAYTDAYSGKTPSGEKIAQLGPIYHQAYLEAHERYSKEIEQQMVSAKAAAEPFTQVEYFTKEGEYLPAVTRKSIIEEELDKETEEFTTEDYAKIKKIEEEKGWETKPVTYEYDPKASKEAGEMVYTGKLPEVPRYTPEEYAKLVDVMKTGLYEGQPSQIKFTPQGIEIVPKEVKEVLRKEWGATKKAVWEPLAIAGTVVTSAIKDVTELEQLEPVMKWIEEHKGPTEWIGQYKKDKWGRPVDPALAMIHESEIMRLEEEQRLRKAGVEDWEIPSSVFFAKTYGKGLLKKFKEVYGKVPKSITFQRDLEMAGLAAAYTREELTKYAKVTPLTPTGEKWTLPITEKAVFDIQKLLGDILSVREAEWNFEQGARSRIQGATTPEQLAKAYSDIAKEQRRLGLSLRSGWETKAEKEGVIAYLERKKGKAYADVYGELASRILFEGPTIWEPGKPVQVGAIAGAIGKGVSFGAGLGEYFVPGVREMRFFGPTAEKFAVGRLPQFAREEPMEVAVAAIYGAATVASKAFAYAKQPVTKWIEPTKKLKIKAIQAKAIGPKFAKGQLKMEVIQPGRRYVTIPRWKTWFYDKPLLTDTMARFPKTIKLAPKGIWKPGKAKVLERAGRKFEIKTGIVREYKGEIIGWPTVVRRRGGARVQYFYTIKGKGKAITEAQWKGLDKATKYSFRESLGFPGPPVSEKTALRLLAGKQVSISKVKAMKLAKIRAISDVKYAFTAKGPKKFTLDIFPSKKPIKMKVTLPPAGKRITRAQLTTYLERKFALTRKEAEEVGEAFWRGRTAGKFTTFPGARAAGRLPVIQEAVLTKGYVHFEPFAMKRVPPVGKFRKGLPWEPIKAIYKKKLPKTEILKPRYPKVKSWKQIQKEIAREQARAEAYGMTIGKEQKVAQQFLVPPIETTFIAAPTAKITPLLGAAVTPIIADIPRLALPRVAPVIAKDVGVIALLAPQLKFVQVPKVTEKLVPKVVTKEIVKTVPKVIPSTVVKVVPKVIPKEVPKLVPQIVPKVVPKIVPKVLPKVIPVPPPYVPTLKVTVPPPPPPPPIIKLSDDLLSRRVKAKPTRPPTGLGFEVAVRKKGEFKKITPFAVPKGEALWLGRRAVKAGAPATFKLIPTPGPVRKLGVPMITEAALLRLEFRRPIKKGKKVEDKLVFIQKRPFRIKTPGELREITYKGIEVRKRKGRKWWQ